MNETIEQAIDQFRRQAGRYRRTERYYRGEHNLNFATEKFQNTFGELFREFALNLCPAVCDAVKDKLKIRGFGIARIDGGDMPPDEIRERLDVIWRENRMAQRAGELHKEALKNGDAYAIVWRGPGESVRIYPNPAETCTVHYDEDEPGRIAWAAKYWRGSDQRIRLNLYFPDRIEKYAAERGDAALADASRFAPSGPAVPNPYGAVPVFHFANDADIGSFGRSELEPVMPVQDGLNKSVLDMLVAMEVCAFRQRWVAGIEIKKDEESGEDINPFTAGIDTIWATENPEARFGDFAASDLEQFLKVKDGFRIDIASVSGTPLYYLMPQLRGYPSGESLRKAETRFIAKVRDRQEQFGAVWADLMAFALRVGGGARASLITNWEDASPANERETLENLRIKKELGISTEQALKEAGYGEMEVKRMGSGDRARR